MPLEDTQFYWECDIGQCSQFPRKVTHIVDAEDGPIMKRLYEQTLYNYSPKYIYAWYDSTCYLGEWILDELYSKLKKVAKKRNPQLFMKKNISLENEEKKDKLITELYSLIEEIHLSADEKSITGMVMSETKIIRPVVRSNNICFRHHLNAKKRRNKIGGEAVKAYWKGIHVRTFKKVPRSKDKVEIKVASFHSEHTYHVGYLCISGEHRT